MRAIGPASRPRSRPARAAGSQARGASARGRRGDPARTARPRNADAEPPGRGRARGGRAARRSARSGETSGAHEKADPPPTQPARSARRASRARAAGRGLAFRGVEDARPRHRPPPPATIGSTANASRSWDAPPGRPNPSSGPDLGPTSPDEPPRRRPFVAGGERTSTGREEPGGEMGPIGRADGPTAGTAGSWTAGPRPRPGSSARASSRTGPRAPAPIGPNPSSVQTTSVRATCAAATCSSRSTPTAPAVRPARRSPRSLGSPSAAWPFARRRGRWTPPRPRAALRSGSGPRPRRSTASSGSG